MAENISRGKVLCSGRPISMTITTSSNEVAKAKTAHDGHNAGGNPVLLLKRFGCGSLTDRDRVAAATHGEYYRRGRGSCQLANENGQPVLMNDDW